VCHAALRCTVLCCPVQVVHTSGHLMRVSVVAVKHQQLLERPGSELHASVSRLRALTSVTGS
jgi:hypothetical protein